MAIRKVFSDESDKQITAYVLASGKLYVEIKDENDLAYITLSDKDAREFILELYRMKGKLTTDKTTYEQG
ncbi:MAG TPA: hypothetical protein VMV77_08785 [Bacteroidales bacterium]|nr:hypothetical protein [Bacteroidales bacterium]